MSCDHEDCGVLCDEHILAERLAMRQAGGRGRSLTVERIRAESLLHIRLERAEGLLRAGRHTRHAIAQQTGLSHQQVGQLAKAIGAEVVQAPPPVDVEETHRIRELHARAGRCGASQTRWAARSRPFLGGCPRDRVPPPPWPTRSVARFFGQGEVPRAADTARRGGADTPSLPSTRRPLFGGAFFVVAMKERRCAKRPRRTSKCS